MSNLKTTVDGVFTGECAEQAVQHIVIGWILAGFAVALLQLT